MSVGQRVAIRADSAFVRFGFHEAGAKGIVETFEPIVHVSLDDGGSASCSTELFDEAFMMEPSDER